MRLFIASSHSLALAIAGVLPGIRQGTDDYIEVGDDVVTWCDGRLLKLCEPDFYDSRWAKCAYSTETGRSVHGKLDSRSVATRGLFFTPDLWV